MHVLPLRPESNGLGVGQPDARSGRTNRPAEHPPARRGHVRDRRAVARRRARRHRRAPARGVRLRHAGAPGAFGLGAVPARRERRDAGRRDPDRCSRRPRLRVQTPRSALSAGRPPGARRIPPELVTQHETIADRPGPARAAPRCGHGVRRRRSPCPSRTSTRRCRRASLELEQYADYTPIRVEKR